MKRDFLFPGVVATQLTPCADPLSGILYKLMRVKSYVRNACDIHGRLRRDYA